LFQAMASHDVARCLHIVEQMALIGADFEQVLASILQILHAIAIAQAVPESEGIAAFADISEELLALKASLSSEVVQLFYQIALMGQKELAHAPSARIGFEMTLLRMMVFRPKEVQMPSLSLNQTAPIEPSKVGHQIAKPQAAPLEMQVDNSVLNWVEVVAKLPLSALALSLVKNCVVSTWDGKWLALILDPMQKACLNPQRQTQIQDALNQYFGYAIKLTITVGDVQSGTPLMIAKAQEEKRSTQAKMAIEEDKTVQNILSTFDGTVEKITAVEP
jgi:DNA polymerase-3 subunit gamma/tau